jgi:Type II secretion system (T2SS), protein G
MIVARRLSSRSSEAALPRPRRLAMGVVAFVLLATVYRVGRADEQRAATRYARQSVEELVWRYRLRHSGRCPRDGAAVARDASRAELPRDGWGRPFALRCPSLREGHEFDVVSAGPDGVAGGLDAVD